MSGMVTPVIDFKHDRFPYCVVWTSIPLLSWLLPFIGHMGIATSDGVIHDFAGPYFVSEDDFAFGRPTRYLRMNPEQCGDAASPASAAIAWDEAIGFGNSVYKRRMHNLICDNCHSHVAVCLNKMAYHGSRSWNMVSLAARMFVFGRYVSVLAAVAHWAPFLCLVAAAVTMGAFA